MESSQEVLDQSEGANLEAKQGLVAALLALALQQERASRFEQAIQNLTRAQQREPDNPQVASALSRVRNLENQRQQQVQVNRVYQSASDHLEAKRWTAAIRSLDDLLGLDPGPGTQSSTG